MDSITDYETCSECGDLFAPNSDGWNGLCGNCADRTEAQIDEQTTNTTRPVVSRKEESVTDPIPSNVHWHAGTGLTGYGVDNNEDAFTTRDDDDGIRALVDYVHDELKQASERAYETALIYGDDHQDYERAWFYVKLSDRLDTDSRNINNERESAPMFQVGGDDHDGRETHWIEYVREHLLPTFPIDIDEHSRLYVWDCAEEECLTILDEESA